MLKTLKPEDRVMIVGVTKDPFSEHCSIPVVIIQIV